MHGALFLKAIAAACVLLCLSTTCLGTAATPSTFIIKSTRDSSMTSGTFHVTGGSRSISLSAGVTYKITCTAGTVVGSITQRWYRDGSAVTKKMEAIMCGLQPEVYYHDESGNSNNWVLMFCHFSSSLMGMYTCRPSPDYNRTLIIEESNPSIIADRDIISKDNGGFATTQAVFLSGIPTPLPDEVTWFFMGETVTGHNPRKSATGGLRFNLFNLATAGMYTCVVNTSAGVTTDSFTVHIRAPPELTLTAQYRYKSKTVFSTSSTFYVPLNANLTFTCTDEHAYPTPTFTWSRNGIAINNVQTVGSNQTKHILYSVQETSTGLYTCEASNGVGNSEKTLHIVVIAPPSLTRITDECTGVFVGGKLSLLVAFNASHKPLTVNWTKVMSGGELAPIETGGRVAFDGQHSLNLSIAGVVSEDAGLYELNVVNEVDSVVLQFNVSVFEPPTLTILNPATQNISVPPKSSLIIRVAISSAIPAVLSQDILWSTSKGQTSFNGSLATLQLSDVTEPISLTLTVHHAVGIKSVSFNVVIQSIGPVLNLRFNPSFSQVSLWDPPSTVGVLSGLTYQVILISNEVIVSETTDNTYYPLPALQSCQYYTANVTAFSSEYHGDSAIFKQRINSKCSEYYNVQSMSQDAAVNPDAKTVSTSAIIGYTPSPSIQSTAAELDDTNVFIICVSGGFLIMLVILVTTVVLLLSRILKHKKDDVTVTDQISVDENPAYITIKKIDMDN